MKFFDSAVIRSGLVIFSVTSAIILSLIGDAFAADPFAVLRGKWGGGGKMVLNDGTIDRLNCNAQYTGSSSQLILAINCTSSSNKIKMKARLSSNAGRLLGVWEEDTYKALGTISGKMTEDRITFFIGGNVIGNMVVRYTKRRQNIAIKTKGIALQNVTMTLRRR